MADGTTTSRLGWLQQLGLTCLGLTWLGCTWLQGCVHPVMGKDPDSPYFMQCIADYPINLRKSQRLNSSEGDPIQPNFFTDQELVTEMTLFVEAAKMGDPHGTFKEQWIALAAPQGSSALVHKSMRRAGLL